MKQTLRDFAQDFALVIVALSASLLFVTTASAAPVLDSKPTLDSKPVLDSGPRLDKPIRAIRTVSVSHARTENVNTWVAHWKEELAKTSDPIMRRSILIQLEALEQARPYVNAKLQQPRPLDPRDSELPEFKQAKTDRDADESLRASAVDFTKRVHGSQQ